MSETKIKVGTLDCQPTWREVLTTLLEVSECGNPDAIAELERMASLADETAALRALLLRVEDVIKWEQVEGYPALVVDLGAALKAAKLQSALNALLRWVKEQPFADQAPDRTGDTEHDLIELRQFLAGRSQNSLSTLPDETVKLVEQALRL